MFMISFIDKSSIRSYLAVIASEETLPVKRQRPEMAGAKTKKRPNTQEKPK